MNSRIFFGILIIAVIGELWICENQAYAESTEVTFPQGLIIASQSGLANLVYNPSIQTYDKKAEIALSDTIDDKRFYPKQVVACGDYIFVSLGGKIFRFDSKFENLISKKLGKIGALATDGKSILVAAERSLIILNENLKELDRTRLEFDEIYEYVEKSVHNILVYKNTAYLLDNISTPLFLFRVNIEDPKDIQVIERIELDAANSHLNGQWLNPELGQWLVTQSYCTQGGSGQIVHIYPIYKGKEELAEHEIFKEMAPGIPQEKEKGLAIKGITDFPPAWSVVQDAENKYHLCQVNSENNKLSFLNFIGLDDSNSYEEVIIKHKDSYLFVAPMGGTLLRVIDIRQQPKIIFSEDLGQYNIRGITDILPY